MLRIIMLVPINKNVNLTTITLSLIYLINKDIKNNFFKSFFYFSLTEKSLDNTEFILNKYFSNNINILKNINFSGKCFNSNEYNLLVNRVIEQCYNKRNIDGLILIKGINKKHHVDADKINYEISQNINAEVIFLDNIKEYSLESINRKKNKIEMFLDDSKYKNILGFIFNNINSPFINKKYNFIEKLKILYNTKENINILKIKKDDFLKNKNFSILTYIPWCKNLLQSSIVAIFSFLNAKIINKININDHVVKKIVIFNGNYSNFIKLNCNNALLLICSSNIKIFVNKLFCHCKLKKVSGIILTGISKRTKDILCSINYLTNSHIPISIIKTNIIITLSNLQNFNFNIHLYNKTYIYKILEYISRYLKKNNFNFLQKKISNNIQKYSPKDFCYRLKMLSKQNIKRIILPEAYEPRILKAASIVDDLGIADCVLLGNAKKIYQIANDQNINLSKNIEVIEPYLIRNSYISKLLELRKNKGMTEFSAKKQLEDNTVLATLILESNIVDGLVSGSINTTANTIRPALQIIKTKSIYSLVSSIFFMLFPTEVFIYGDCAINIDPTSEELAEIAIQSANSAKILGIEPRIAMLSYSSGYSGYGLQVEKVRNATSIVRVKQPNLIVEGPIQYDAAISQTVSKLKTPNSLLSGYANIFIFPDLNAGNITYKAVQRSLGLISLGPMLQGLRKPVNDLSRGASIEDIVYTIALTSIQS